jgi:hypothetical protein
VADPDLIHQSSTIFDWPDTPTTSILELQTSPTQPLPSDLSTGTGLLAPDVPTATRLAHFPSDLYDLSDSSHLTRLLKAMLGDSGAGQLRKRQLVARLQTLLNSTHFYDLDAFYGSLFGVNRGVTGSLPINPYTDVATADGWDEISTIDAQFREKLLALARAITMGGTPLGLQAMAEALTGVDCDVYEVWALLDAQGASGTGRTWSAVESAYPSWDSIEGVSYNDISGTQAFGNMGTDCRNEIVIRPKKVYDNTPEGQRERADDIRGILRVLEVLKPASALLSVDTNGVGVHAEATPGSITADSNYWEISARTVPKPEVKKFYNRSRRSPTTATRTRTASTRPSRSRRSPAPRASSGVTRRRWSRSSPSPPAASTPEPTTSPQRPSSSRPWSTTRPLPGRHGPQTYLPSYAVIDPRRRRPGASAPTAS